MHSRRQLGKLELAWGKNIGAGSGFMLGCYRLKGDYQKNSLDLALQDLQKTHPILSTRVENRHGELFFTDKDVGLIFVDEMILESECDYQNQLSAVLNETLDWSEGPLLSVQVWKLKHTPQEWVLCLVAHPAALDSSSLHYLATHLILKLQAKTSIQMAPLPLPMMPSLDRLIPDEPFSLDLPLRLFKFAAHHLGSQFFLRPKISFQNFGSSSQKDMQPKMFSVRKTFTSVQLDSLEKACREHGLHLVSALWSAFAMASYRMNHVHLSAVAYQLITQVSVRGFLEPPVPKHVLGCYSSFVTLAERVGASTDFWTFAHHLKSKFDRSVLEGEALSFVTFATQLADLFLRRSARRLFSLQFQEFEKWPEQIQKGHLQVVESFESQAAGAFGNQCCLGISHNAQGFSLALTANSGAMDQEHAMLFLNYVIEILSVNTGVDLNVIQRSGATTAKNKSSKPTKQKSVNVEGDKLAER